MCTHFTAHAVFLQNILVEFFDKNYKQTRIQQQIIERKNLNEKYLFVEAFWTGGFLVENPVEKSKDSSLKESKRKVL